MVCYCKFQFVFSSGRRSLFTGYIIVRCYTISILTLRPLHYLLYWFVRPRCSLGRRDRVLVRHEPWTHHVQPTWRTLSRLSTHRTYQTQVTRHRSSWRVRKQFHIRLLDVRYCCSSLHLRERTRRAFIKTHNAIKRPRTRYPVCVVVAFEARKYLSISLMPNFCAKWCECV